jgi:Avidin family
MSQESVEGVWYNELGSTMRLECGEDGRLSGTYALNAQVATGSSTEPHPLTGFVDLAPETETAAVGFAVLWPAAHAITTWLGRFDSMRDVLTTTWLYTGGMASRTTMVGPDVFTR